MPVQPFAAAPVPASNDSGALVCPDGRILPLRHTVLQARARGGIARTVVRQTFINPHAEALEVTYQLPLPADGAVSGFRFELDGVEVLGEVDRRHIARARYEQALMDGRTAALLDQERSSLFTQRVGNIPPRSTVVCEVTVDQRLAWLDEGAWEWRFPTVVGARYLGAPGRVVDADRVRVEASEAPLPHRLTLALTVADELPGGHMPESSTHPTAVVRADSGVVVSFRDDDGVRLDRDVVVRWPVDDVEAGLSLDVSRAPEGAPDRGSVYGLLTVVPPTPDTTLRPLPRDLIVLIDTSGSMGGRPLEQAARVVGAMIDTLTERDRIELIEFSSTPRRWKMSPVYANESYRREAIAWVRGLRASGSTEMRTALLAALKPLRAGAQRQVVLITDGYIGFEREIIETVYHKLPGGCRLHTLGVGSSVNRALTRPAAQAGRGVELVVGLDEDPERAARRLVERTHAPFITELSIEGPGVAVVAPARLPDLFAASPVLVSLKLGAPGTAICVRGKTDRGTWEQVVTVPRESVSTNGAVRARFARDRVEDHELHIAAGGDVGELDAAIESLGVDYQIATRLTSWVAVSRVRTVDPEEARRREVQPQEVPYGVSAEGMGLRATRQVGRTGGNASDAEASFVAEGELAEEAWITDSGYDGMDVSTGSFAAASMRSHGPDGAPSGRRSTEGSMVRPYVLSHPAPRSPSLRESGPGGYLSLDSPERFPPSEAPSVVPSVPSMRPAPLSTPEEAPLSAPPARRVLLRWGWLLAWVVVVVLAVLMVRAFVGSASSPAPTPRRGGVTHPVLPASPVR